MAQTWEDLLFAHWPVAEGVLRGHVPQGLRVESFDGSAWLGVTPFRITGLRVRGLPPLPYVSSFTEVNVRTYVSAGEKPGIWFFSLDASSRFAVEAARALYRLPYFHAHMAVWRNGEAVDYESKRVGGHAELEVRYRPDGAVAAAEEGTLEHFLTERYCLYASDRGRLRRAEIHHPPWPLQPALAKIRRNTMLPLGIEFPTTPPLLHFSRRQDVLIWSLGEPL